MYLKSIVRVKSSPENGFLYPCWCREARRLYYRQLEVCKGDEL